MPRAKPNRLQRRSPFHTRMQRIAEKQGFARKHNERMRHAIARKVVGFGPTPKVRDLCRSVGLAAVGITVKAYDEANLTVDEDTLLNRARHAMLRWTSKRRALERAMDAQRILLVENDERNREGNTYKSMRLCIRGRITQANIKLHGAVPIALDYKLRSQLKHCVMVEVDMKPLPDTVCSWLRKELTHSVELGFYYCKPEKITGFVATLRNQLRACQRDNHPFKLTTIDLNEEPVPAF